MHISACIHTHWPSHTCITLFAASTTDTLYAYVCVCVFVGELFFIIWLSQASLHKRRRSHGVTSQELAQQRHMVVQRVIRLCVDNICDLIQKYGWQRVDRQLQHASRGREFICSMLYLMRMGITFKNQTILQKMDVLNGLLPLQVFLPTVFKIRAKSITEGENIIKLDLQRVPV